MSILTSFIFLILFNVILGVKVPLQRNCALTVKLVYPPGQIRGHTLKSAKGEDYYAFQEIPFAEPPVGKLRYKVPKRHPGWNGILNTTKNTKVCPQIDYNALPNKEDCLYLNVFTPVLPGTRANLPVYIWIHGGGFSAWDSVRYRPDYLIDYDIVVVTIQYRLGPLGFLSTDDGIIPGNLGLRDQHLAFQWVNENIHLFGGDPEKVTIGGESAGSTSTSLHLLSDFSQGLFRAAIMESGTGINIYSYVKNPSIYAFQVGKLLNSSIDSQNTTRLLEVLQEADVADIISAARQVPPIDKGVFTYPDLVWAPTVETEYIEEPFLSKHMHEAYISGDFKRVPTLMGYNSEEMLVFLPSADGDWSRINSNIAELDADPTRLISYKMNINNNSKQAIGLELKKLYTNVSFAEDPYAYVQASSDFYFILAIARVAEIASKYAPIYFYEFDYQATPILKFPGTQHTEELQYFWSSGADDVDSFQPILRNRLCKLWTNFIKYQNPTPEDDTDLNNIKWSAMKSNNISFLYINKDFDIRTKPRNYFEVKDIILNHLEPPLAVF